MCKETSVKGYFIFGQIYLLQKTLDFYFDMYYNLSSNGVQRRWQRAWFGTKRPWVQIPLLRPIRLSVTREALFFSLKASCLSRTDVRDQVTEPSAACGGRSEAEEGKNKELGEALQASIMTMFFQVAVGSNPATPTNKNPYISTVYVNV